MPQITQLRDVPVVSSDDNSASASSFPLFDIVNVMEALPGIGSLELPSQIVVTNASGIYYGFRREDVLFVFESVIRMDGRPDAVTGAHRSTSGSILCSSSSNIGNLVISHNLFVAIN